MASAPRTPVAWLIALVLASTGLASAQDQTGSPIQGPLTKPQGNPVTDPRLNSRIDGVVAVVGDEVITLHQLLTEIQDFRYQERRIEYEKLPPADQERAYGELQNEAIAQLVERLLRTRAGKDRGFDPAIVERLVANQVTTFIEREGGPIGFSKLLERSGYTPESFREWRREALYLSAWEYSTTGDQPGPVGRIDRDTYVRPGQLLSTYQRLAVSPIAEEQAIVGASIGEVLVSELALSIEANGGERATLELADNLRQFVLEDGQDFDKLAATHGEKRRAQHISSDMGGVLRASKGTFGNDHLLIFSETASPGEVSRPLRSRDGGLYLYQLLERKPAKKAEPFQSIELQERLRDYIGEHRGRIRLGRGTEQLLRTIRIQPEALGSFMIQPSWLYRENNLHSR